MWHLSDHKQRLPVIENWARIAFQTYKRASQRSVGASGPGRAKFRNRGIDPWGGSILPSPYTTPSNRGGGRTGREGICIPLVGRNEAEYLKF